MNILQITNKALFPPDGGTLAISNFAYAYAKLNHNVTILSMVTHKHYLNNLDSSDLLEKKIELIGVKVNTKISLFKLLKNLFFSKIPYNLERFISIDFAEKLTSLLKEKKWDIIQIEGLYVLSYIDLIRKNSLGKIVYRPHNIEYKIWEENANCSKSIIKTVYFGILAKRLKNFELNLLNTYDIVLPISNSDADFYKENGNNKPILVSPFGVNVREFKSYFVQPEKLNTNSTILFIGALDWIPNQQGLTWFIDKCFPLIVNLIPNVELIIAGRNAPKWYFKKFNSKNINFIGQVNNAYEFLSKSGPVIAPLFSGSGMRVKIIEAMALKKAIVTTTKGAEGIDGLNPNNILIADNANIFAEMVVKLLRNNDLQNNMGNLAHKLIIEQYSVEKIGSLAIQFINQN
ncbi:MAG: hypothetical protein A2041_02005 [Bacteroidetes bacterium GWA2_31_9b]|nr:MAG: hypothetical protein A2041_02005 [Bacteroidetes bacterium GWA2_31_9b]